MGYMHQFFWNVLDELFFGSEGSFGVQGEANACCYPEDVGVYRHVGLLVNYRGNDISCFSAYAGERNQFINREWDLAIKLRLELLGHPNQVLGFVVGV